MNVIREVLPKSRTHYSSEIRGLFYVCCLIKFSSLLGHATCDYWIPILKMVFLRCRRRKNL